MHQLVRQYASDRLDADDAEDLPGRHAVWVAGQLEQAQPAELDAMELDDARAATEWMLAHADADHLASYLRDLAELYRRRSYWRSCARSPRPHSTGLDCRPWRGRSARAGRRVASQRR